MAPVLSALLTSLVSRVRHHTSVHLENIALRQWTAQQIVDAFPWDDKGLNASQEVARLLWSFSIPIIGVCWRGVSRQGGKICSLG